MKEIKQFISNNSDRILTELFDLLKIKSVSADSTFKQDVKDAARHAILAGSDMDMMSSASLKHLNQLVKEKTISIDIINDAVIRVLGLKYDLGLFSDPYRYCNLERENEYVLNAENRQIALEMAKESIVLLKNEKNILPLKKSGLKIALVGALAKDKDSPLGNWTANGPKNSAVSVLEGLKRGNTNILTYQEGPKLINKPTFFHEHVDINDSDTTGTKKALNSTKDADVVIAVLGEHGLQSGEGRSRTKIDLPGLQMNFLKQLHKKNKNIILVVGKTFGHLGQSCFLKENYSIIEGMPPEINLLNEKNNGETLLKLIEAGYIKSAHDVSIGGIITAVSKMCIKGNKGINLKKPRYLINEIEYYFAEDQGRYIIEVNKDGLKKVTDILNKNAVHFDELGTIIEDQLFINEKTKVSIDELTTSNTNWLTNYMSK